jgi:hypothetical protein
MLKKTSMYIAAVFLVPNLGGCITSHVYQEAVAKHRKPDAFVLKTACKSDAEIILKVSGTAAGEDGDFDIYVDQASLNSYGAQQPIEVPRRIKTTKSSQCPTGSPVLATDRQILENAYIVKANENQHFAYFTESKKLIFKIKEESYRPDLYKVMFTPLTLMADVIVTPIMYLYLVIKVGHIDG